MFGDGPLMLREYLMNEPHPIGMVQGAVFDFLREQTDYAIFGAQADNAHASETRATEDVNIVAIKGLAFAEAIARYLNKRFYIATRVRSVRDGIGFRVYQIQKPKNRHLVDVRPSPQLPPHQLVDGVQVVTPAESVANKLESFASRSGKRKGYTDGRDILAMLETFPNLKTFHGPVHDRLVANGVAPPVFDLWRQWVDRVLEPEDEADDFGY